MGYLPKLLAPKFNDSTGPLWDHMHGLMDHSLRTTALDLCIHSYTPA